VSDWLDRVFPEDPNAPPFVGREPDPGPDVTPEVRERPVWAAWFLGWPARNITPLQLTGLVGHVWRTDR